MLLHLLSISSTVNSYGRFDTDKPQVLDTPEPLRNLAELIAAQLEYHKKAYEILSELAPVVDGLQVEQEVRRSEDFE